MNFNKIKSFAKINLALNITGKTHSLHKIESIIAFVDLHDDIFIRKIKSKKHNVSFSGKFSANISKDNTITKLLNLLDKNEFLNNKKFQIKINKKIPSKAGLGGGSMNAANILRYFIKKKIIKITKKKLIKISGLIGSDVILGQNSTNCILTCKNEIKKFSNCKKFYMLIVKPNFGCSTKDIYSKVRKFNKSKLNRPNKKMFDLDFLEKMSNSLESIVFSKYPELQKIKFFLENLSKPVFVRMTGSGSAMVAYFYSKKRCDMAKKLFNKKYKNYWCIVSKTI
jgi:4-diphosphocytidyl-2-C-methyl-D-erythritol kinase